MHLQTNGGDKNSLYSWCMCHYQVGIMQYSVHNLAKVCYHSITHSSASAQGRHVSPALDRLPELSLQVWLTGLEGDGPPTLFYSSKPQSTLSLLGGV